VRLCLDVEVGCRGGLLISSIALYNSRTVSIAVVLLLPVLIQDVPLFHASSYFSPPDGYPRHTYTLVVNDLGNSSETSFVFARCEENDTADLNEAPLRCGNVSFTHYADV